MSQTPVPFKLLFSISIFQYNEKTNKKSSVLSMGPLNQIPLHQPINKSHQFYFLKLQNPAILLLSFCFDSPISLGWISFAVIFVPSFNQFPPPWVGIPFCNISQNMDDTLLDPLVFTGLIQDKSQRAFKVA